MARSIGNLRSSVIIAFALSLILCGCSRIKYKYGEVKERILESIDAAFSSDFYSDYGAWDYYRVPLIAPYELNCYWMTRIIWRLSKRQNVDAFDYYADDIYSGRRPVEYAGISDSIIYLSYTEDTVDNVSNYMELRRFAIIDVPTYSVAWHETKEDWLSALEKRNIMNPQLHRVDSLYEVFANHKQLLFNPPK